MLQNLLPPFAATLRAGFFGARGNQHPRDSIIWLLQTVSLLILGGGRLTVLGVWRLWMRDLGLCLRDVILRCLINASCSSLTEYCSVHLFYFFFRREKLYISSLSLRKGARGRAQDVSRCYPSQTSPVGFFTYAQLIRSYLPSLKYDLIQLCAGV